jgi:hypothetical protein
MSVNHKLYIKITTSKDMHKTIEIEDKKLINKIKKLKASNKILTNKYKNKNNNEEIGLIIKKDEK